MAEHDQSYKQFFSNPRMVEDLLRGFVKQDWLEQADYDTLERVTASFVSDKLKKRESDAIWQIRLKDGLMYIYILIEFQSTVDRFMVVRMLTYIGLLYQDLIKSGKIKEGDYLPPVLPLVLYNGRTPWKAPLDMEKLVAPAPGKLKEYQANLRLLLIDEGRLQASQLEQERNLASVLFALENSRDPQEMERAVSLLGDWLAEPDFNELRRTFFEWLSRVFLPVHFPGIDFSKIDKLSEVKNMLAERVIEWTEEWKQQGRQEGLQQGLQQGVQQGLQQGVQQGLQQGFQKGILQSRREDVLDVLNDRFGATEQDIADKLQAIEDPIRLKNLLHKAIHISSIKDFIELLK